MMRTLKVAGLLVLGVAAGLCYQNEPKASNAAASQPQTAVNPAQENAPRPAGKGPARLGNPSNPVQRLLLMSPEQRERAIEKLPASQQERLRKLFEQFDNLPPAEKERRIRFWNAFSAIPPDKREILDRQIETYNHLPPERLEVVGPELQRLWRMSPEGRRARLASDSFKSQFTPGEQRMLADLAEYYPFPRR